MQTPLELSDSARDSLVEAMEDDAPFVVRSGLPEEDARNLLHDWEQYIARDDVKYQMGGSQGRQLLKKMWESSMRLEHDLDDRRIPNPVESWLCREPIVSDVRGRFARLQKNIETIADSQGHTILRRPAFAAGLIETGGGPTHFDDYNNAALVLAGKKTFYIAPPGALKWEDGHRNGRRNERLDVEPLYLEPPLDAWQVAVLGPGDVLYLPKRWWHFVVTEQKSVMTNVWTDVLPDVHTPMRRSKRLRTRERRTR